jgi:hypothetical protein
MIHVVEIIPMQTHRAGSKYPFSKQNFQFSNKFIKILKYFI